LIRFEGKDVLTELRELASPRRAALLLVDMQQDFVAADGAFASLGIDVSMYAEMRPRGKRRPACWPTSRPAAARRCSSDAT
jgi:nicotinamidase-related amidase